MNVYRDLLKLGLPIMIGQLGIIILSFADTMMVGRCGTAELGAASFVNNMFNLVIVFSTGFSYGLTPFVGNHYGRGENASVGRILKNALAVNAVVAAGLMALMFVLYLNIHRLGQPAELLPLMRPYYIVLLISLMFVLLFNAFKQFADGITDTVTPMAILLGGNVINIFLNWVLIYGNLGMPRLGLLGAGVATMTARILMLLCFMAVFFTAKRYRPFVRGFKESSVNKEDFVALNKMGMPVGLQMGMETASFSLSTIMVGWLGTVALAAHQVMLTVGHLGFMMYYGMAAAVAVRASNFHGQGDVVRVRENVSAGFRIILVMAAAVSIPLLIMRNSLGFLFADSAEVAAMVAQLVIPFAIYQFGDGLQCNYSNALRGISDVKMVMVYAFIAYFLISLPSAYIFGFVLDWGLTGIWMSFPLGLTSAGLLFYRRYRRSISI
ncbi:MAG: MATE family efflux transporter [Bacteroidales bacterium]|nr:MATE family efflux transporter [Bacteroidales bacterium]